MLEDYANKELPSLNGGSREVLEEESKNVRIREGKYYDSLDFEIFKTETRLKLLPDYSRFEKVKHLFKTLPKRYKLMKLKLKRKLHKNEVYMKK